MKTFINTTAALLAVLVFSAPSYAWNAFNETNGTLEVQNLDCGDFDFHIYGNDGSCTIENDYEIKDGATASVTVIDTFDSNRQDLSDKSYTENVKCEYAVEAIGEILGGYKYSAGDTVVCRMKTSSVLFKACRCN